MPSEQSEKHKANFKRKRNLWTPAEDNKLCNHINRFGVDNWSSLPELAGVERSAKSCRLRWFNYLRPELKRERISQEEEDLIIYLHKILGNRWTQIAEQLPGRTDNEIKNYWHSHINNKFKRKYVDSNTSLGVNSDAETSENKRAGLNLYNIRNKSTFPFFELQEETQYNTVNQSNENNYFEIEQSVDKLISDDEFLNFGMEESGCLLQWATYDVDDLLINLPLFQFSPEASKDQS